MAASRYSLCARAQGCNATNSAERRPGHEPGAPRLDCSGMGCLRKNHFLTVNLLLFVNLLMFGFGFLSIAGGVLYLLIGTQTTTSL